MRISAFKIRATFGAASDDAAYDLDAVVGKIIDKRLGQSPGDADIEKLYDNIVVPFLNTLKLKDQYFVTLAFENCRQPAAIGPLKVLADQDAIKPDHKILDPKVQKSLTNARHWIGRHTNEKDLDTAGVIEEEKSRLTRILHGLADSVAALLLADLRKDNNDNYVPIPPEDLQKISDNHFLSKPHTP
jgi:hypothetical protein